MKKLKFSALHLSVFCLCLFISCNNEPVTLINCPEAKVEEVPLNENLAASFPQSLIFIAKVTGSSYLLIMNSLPTMQRTYISAFSKMAYGNVTVLSCDGKTFGLMPKHLFGNEVDLISLLSLNGFNVKQEVGDLVMVRLDNSQFSIKNEALQNIDSSAIQGADCTVKTLNCFKGDDFIHQFTITGKVFYFSREEMSLLSKGVVQSNGQPSTMAFNRGAYLVKVPKSLWPKILGMSGGSLVAKINGEERFLGIQTGRTLMGDIKSNGDTTLFYTIVFEPVLKKDITVSSL